MQNILVVEDDSDLNQAICYSLKKSGYGVYGVTFMEKGKQIFFENQIDMVLLDVNLPGGRGLLFLPVGKKAKRSSGHLPDSQGYGGGCSDRI